jgi:hypothetical protein
MRSTNSRKPHPPRHGQIEVAKMKLGHAKAHLRAMAASAAEVRDYGGHEATGYDSPGCYGSGWRGGLGHQTTSVNDTPDSDFTGTSY